MLRPRPIPEDVPLRILWNHDEEDSVCTRDSEYEYSHDEDQPSVQEIRHQVRYHINWLTCSERSGNTFMENCGHL